MFVQPILDLIRHFNRPLFIANRHSGRQAACELLEERICMSVSPILVKNIATNDGGESNPADLTNVNGTLFFSANSGNGSGAELWKSDGTAAGTVEVAEIRPGPLGSAPHDFLNLNGTLFFVANDGVSGDELWMSKGTPEETSRVQDIATGPAGSNPHSLTIVNDTLYFVANDGVTGDELWKSDGTSQGTVLVQDIQPGMNGSSPTNLTDFHGTLYFSADDGVAGAELWRSDATSDEKVNVTVMVKDIAPGLLSSSPAWLTSFNDLLYFSANDGEVGTELWESNGTSQGTILVRDLFTGGYAGVPYGSAPKELTVMKGVLYFSAAGTAVDGTELWKTDGTGEGMVEVKNISVPVGGSDPSRLTVVNDELFFEAFNPVDDHRYSLWESDGTEAGTNELLYHHPGHRGPYPGALTNVNGTLYFVASPTDDLGFDRGVELWSSNGTVGGTMMVQDLNPGFYSSVPAFLTTVNGVLFFSANDGQFGNELWRLAEGDAAPTGISLSSTSIQENNQPDASVGTLTATDPNGGEVFAYRLIDGDGDTDNNRFRIEGDQLDVLEVTNQANQSSYSIRVQVIIPGGLTFEKTFTITVTGGQSVNHAPTDLSLSSSSVDENISPNSQVGLLNATDPDSGETLTYSLIPGTGSADNASFAIVSHAQPEGFALNLLVSADFESKSSFSIRLRVVDHGGLIFEKPFTITVNDINEAPVIPSGQTFDVFPNSNLGTSIGAVLATEPDKSGPNSVKNYSITAGNFSGAFAINLATGQLTVASPTSLTALAGQTVSLQITESDSGTPQLSAIQTVSIVVGPLNVAPVLSNPGPAPTFIGKQKTPVQPFSTISMTDADGAATFARVIVTISLNGLKKNPHTLDFPHAKKQPVIPPSIGTLASTIIGGNFVTTISIQNGVLNSTVQELIRTMTFSTKGTGLKISQITPTIQVMDRTGLLSNVVTQQITIRPK